MCVCAITCELHGSQVETPVRHLLVLDSGISCFLSETISLDKLRCLSFCIRLLRIVNGCYLLRNSS